MTAAHVQDAGLESSLAVGVVAAPNPVRGDMARFIATGGGLVELLRLEIFDLSGQSLIDSGWQSGSVWEWDLRSHGGQMVANGAYVCIALVRVSGETIIRSSFFTLFIVR